MTAESDAKFVERMRWLLAPRMPIDDFNRLIALARRGAAMQWRPISRLDDEMDGAVMAWNKRGWPALRNQILAADVNKYSHFIPLSALPPPPEGEQTDV